MLNSQIADEALSKPDALENGVESEGPKETINVKGQVEEAMEEELEEDCILQFTRIWINEQNAPEVLNYAHDLIGNVLELLDNQQTILDEMQPETPEASFAHYLYQMEMDRIKFMVQKYLQHRLLKLQAYWMFYNRFSREELSGFLSPAEIDFLFQFKQDVVAALRDSVLDHLPAPLGKLPGVDDIENDNAILIPPLQSHVVLRVRETIGAVNVDPLSMTPADLVAGDLYVVQYKIVRSFLQQGLVELV